MTELETLRRAKMYMEKLADGIDPITDLPAPEGDIINNARLSRCFLYVCGVLERAEEQERKKANKNLPPFRADINELSKIHPLNFHARISQLVGHINDKIADGRMKKLSSTTVTSWLAELGFLESLNGTRGKRPTQRGRALGISTQQQPGLKGDYTAVIYSPAAQQFILDNLPAALEFAAGKN